METPALAMTMVRLSRRSSMTTGAAAFKHSDAGKRSHVGKHSDAGAATGAPPSGGAGLQPLEVLDRNLIR
jgi:hypothetical protein